METTAPGMWIGVLISLAFWGLIIAAISYLVARAVVRHEMKRMTFTSAEPVRPLEREHDNDLPPQDRL